MRGWGGEGRSAERSGEEEGSERKVEEASKEVLWRVREEKERKTGGEEGRVEAGAYNHHGLTTSMSG